MCLREIRPLQRSKITICLSVSPPLSFSPHLAYCHSTITYTRGSRKGKLVYRYYRDTYITLERLLPCVGPHVLIQPSFLAEGFVTLAAFIGFLLQQHTDTHTRFKEGTSSVSVQQDNTQNNASPVQSHMDKTWGKKCNDTHMCTHIRKRKQHTEKHKKMWKYPCNTHTQAHFHTSICSLHHPVFSM